MVEVVSDRDGLEVARCAFDIEFVFYPVFSRMFLSSDHPTWLDILTTEVSHSLVFAQVQ